ncbi:hypothetical protein GIB67_003236 [Kingdonia uniflora]|uniref:Uncharacterized protein n=1 Tax=Kingdonia uniflora TaxID=39325 RepID=A0A7J7LGV3_9MAGN|nr:hypothetical protein GIB67_003236 [Kingdonia uniflora]
MVETKRKQMDVSRAKGYNNNNKRKGFSSKPQNQTLERKKSKKSNNSRRDDNRKKRGPRLPSAIRKEIGIVKHNPGDSEEDLDSDQGDEELDPFELEDEPLAEEDLKKNRRFDPVDNLEYKFPEEFEVGSVYLSY